MADIEQKIKLSFENNAEENAKEVDKLTDSTERVTKEMPKLEDAQKKATKASKAQNDAIKDLAPAATSAVESLKTMGKAMYALVANPLGAVLAAIAVVLGVLFLAFKSFQPLVDKVEQSFAALGAVVNVIKNTFIAVVTGTKSLGDAFGGLSGDMDDAAKRTMKLVKAQQDLEDVMKSQEVTTARNRAEINKLNVELKNRTLSEEDRLKITDKIEKKINQDYEQRKKNVDQEVRLAREAIAIKAKFSADEIKLLKKTGDATKELAESRGGNYDEEYDRLNNARKAAIALEDEATVNTERIYNKRDKLEDDRIAKEEKRKADSVAAAEKTTAKQTKANEKKAEADKVEQERIRLSAEKSRQDYEDAEKSIADAKKANEDSLKSENQIKVEKEIADFKAKKARLIAANLSTEEIEKEHKRNLANLNNEYYAGQADKANENADDEIETDKRILEQKQALQDAKRNLEESAFGFLKQIAGKNKTLQKALIIAESALGIGRSIISTNAANVAATAEGAALAIPTAGASVAAAAGIVTANTISSGIGIAANIAATAKALSALGGGSAGGGQTSGGRGAPSSASATPQVNFQASSENQIGNTMAGKLNAQAPIRVTVLESDITKTQTSVQAKVVSNSF